MKLVKESLITETLNERLSLDEGITWVINVILFITAFVGTTLLKSISAPLAWVIIGSIISIYGFLAATLGAFGELNYGDFIEELADRKKARKLRKNPEKIEEVGNMVEDAILTNPNIKRGQKAHITSLQNHLAKYIEQKDWRSVRNKLNEIIKYLKRLEEDNEYIVESKNYKTMTNINENKDLQRIKDIKNKARNKDEEYKLASTQAKRIQDPEKAFRRWENALYIGGEKWIVTQIFFRRALQLEHPEALEIQEENRRKYYMEKGETPPPKMFK